MTMLPTKDNNLKRQEEMDKLSAQAWKKRDEIEQMLCEKLGIKDENHARPEERKHVWKHLFKLKNKAWMHDKHSPLGKIMKSEIKLLEMEVYIQTLIDRVLSLEKQYSNVDISVLVDEVSYQEKKIKQQLKGSKIPHSGIVLVDGWPVSGKTPLLLDIIKKNLSKKNKKNSSIAKNLEKGNVNK